MKQQATILHVVGAILLGGCLGLVIKKFAFDSVSSDSYLSKRCYTLLSLIEMQQQLIQDLERRIERLEQQNKNGRSYPQDRPVPRIERKTDHRVHYRPQAP